MGTIWNEEEYQKLKAEHDKPMPAKWQKPTAKWLRESNQIALYELHEQGMPDKEIGRMCHAARPLGDLTAYEQNYSRPVDIYNREIFPWSRKAGVDESVPNAYGASSIAAKLGISPYVSPEEDYDSYLGIPFDKEEDEETKQMIFRCGHAMEGIYRNYFRNMFKNRYLVFECNIQWASRRFPHFVGDIDGLLYDKVEHKFGILEIKHTMYNNVSMIRAFKTDHVPKHYEVQGRGYMELLDASFVCFVLGFGNRENEQSLVMSRIERDPQLGKDILDRCESFITDHVEKKVPPTFRDIKDRKLREQRIKEIFGTVDEDAPTVEFDRSMKVSLDALLKAKEEYETAKEKLKEMEAKVDQLQNVYESYQLPFIEKMDENECGHMKVGTRDFYITYRGRKGVDIDMLMAKYPSVYQKVVKPAINTPKLKREFNDAYKDCYHVKQGAKRTFDVREYDKTKR